MEFDVNAARQRAHELSYRLADFVDKLIVQVNETQEEVNAVAPKVVSYLTEYSAYIRDYADRAAAGTTWSQATDNTDAIKNFNKAFAEWIEELRKSGETDPPTTP